MYFHSLDKDLSMLFQVEFPFKKRLVSDQLFNGVDVYIFHNSTKHFDL